MKFKLLLLVILSASLALKLYQLEQLSLFSDEADAAYQACIFNQFHTDYHGRPFPVHFKSFSDFRTPLYIYSIAMFQKLLGPQPITARLPSIFFALTASLFFYLIIKKQFQNQWLALLGLILFNLNPWLFHYSRTGFEVSGMLACLLAAVFFLQRQKLDLFLFFLLLSPYFYSTAKLFAFFILFFVLLLFRKNIHPAQLPRLALIGLLICLPLLIETLKGNAGYRFSYINIFTDPTIPKQVDYQRFQDAVIDYPGQIGLSPNLISRLIHNKISLWGSKISRNYLASFSTDFLFLTADANLRHGFSSKGYLLYPDLLLIPLGLIYLFNHRQKTSLLFFFILITAPIPFALTRDSSSPHGTRLILMAPSLIYFSLLGLRYLWAHTKIILIFLVFYLLSFLDFFHFYHYHYSILSARDWHTGIKPAISASLASPASRIYYADNYESFLPFFLFYQRYLPSQGNILNHLIWNNTDFFTGQSLDKKYYFGHLDWAQLKNQPLPNNTLFVVPQSQLEAIKTAALSIKNQQLIPPQYDSQETFYLISLNEK